MEILDDGLEELQTHIETLAKQSETSALETEGMLIFEYIGQKAYLFRILFKSQSVTRIRKKVVQNIAVIFQKSCLPLARLGNPTATAILSNHIATSLLALIEWWLDNNMKPAPTQMGKVYKSLTIDSTVGVVRTVSAMSKQFMISCDKQSSSRYLRLSGFAGFSNHTSISPLPFMFT
jgi:tetracycline repressor-like protein